jgi:DNA replication and repair protein RecF
MWVKSLKINNLRNIKTAEIEPVSSLNCFIGDNGAGKTTVLEALAILSKGRSFRPGQIVSVVGGHGDRLMVTGSVESDGGTLHRLGIDRGPENWAARRNGQDVAQLSELTQHVPFVLLEPSSHTLVSGPPEGRRKYLDWGVFHVKHDYLTLWRRYSRVLKQRNAALRRAEKHVVSALTPQMVDLGEKVHAARAEQADALLDILREKLQVFNEVLDGVDFSYRKGWSGERLEDAVSQAAQKDFDRGVTGPGPHKADLRLTFEGQPAREHLSRGEQKSLTAALALAQAKLIADAGETPLLLLDDLASELDQAHLVRILAEGCDMGMQTWLTGTRLAGAAEAWHGEHRMFHVKHGQVMGAG